MPVLEPHLYFKSDGLQLSTFLLTLRRVAFTRKPHVNSFVFTEVNDMVQELDINWVDLDLIQAFD